MKRTVTLLAGLLCLLSASYAGAEAVTGPATDLEFVTGEHWVKSSEQQQRAYLYGIGNLLELMQALEGPDAANDSFVGVMIHGLSPLGMEGVIDALDAWYQANPDKVDHPVLQVLYRDIALPRI